MKVDDDSTDAKSEHLVSKASLNYACIFLLLPSLWEGDLSSY